MSGQNATKFSFKRSMQVVTLSDKSDIKIQGEGVHIDTQLLFQRLTAVADRYFENVSEIFQYELASVPSSLLTLQVCRESHTKLHFLMHFGNLVTVNAYLQTTNIIHSLLLMAGHFCSA